MSSKTNSALDWLIGRRLEALTKRDFDWVFQFKNDTAIVAACLWRLLENGRIRTTGEDHGHKFGLPAAVDCEALVNQRLSGLVIRTVDLHEGTLDLRIQFESGAVIELLPNSSGYEAWEISRVGQRFIALGGGRLDVMDDRRSPDD